MIKNALFLCVVCAVLFLFYLPSYVRMQDFSEKNRVYEKRIHELVQDNLELEEERRRLLEDPFYFEKVAREKMGIIREDEVIYKLVNSNNNDDGSPAEDISILVKPVDDAEPKPKEVKAAVVPKAAATAKPAVKKKSTTSTKSSTKKKSTKTATSKEKKTSTP